MGVGYSQYEEESEQWRDCCTGDDHGVTAPVHGPTKNRARQGGRAATIGRLLVYDGFRGKILPDYRLFPEVLTLAQIMELNLYVFPLTWDNWDETFSAYLDVEDKIGRSEIGWLRTKKKRSNQTTKGRCTYHRRSVEEKRW